MIRPYRCTTGTALRATLLLLLLLALGTSTASAQFFGRRRAASNPPPPPPPEPAEVDYYAVLELEKLGAEATERDIRQSFRRLSRQYHPDVAGGEAARERYSAINRAYEVLSDKRKRKMYDMRGEEGLTQLEQAMRGGGAHQQGHPLSQLFGFGGGGGGGGDGLRGPDMQGHIDVSLETAFTGGKTSFVVGKQKVCGGCKGSGVERGSPIVACPHCGGRGQVRQRLQLGPGMYQEMIGACPHCQGHGRIAKVPCRICRGQRVVRGETRLTVDIEQGVPEGHVVTFEMEAEESPDRIPGDLKLAIHTKPHPRFRRRRNPMDLETSLTITPVEALLGFETQLIHLDGKEVVTVRSTSVVGHGAVLKVAGRGMPRLHFPSERGDLFVTVAIQMPETLTEAQRAAVEKYL